MKTEEKGRAMSREVQYSAMRFIIISSVMQSHLYQTSKARDIIVLGHKYHH